MHVLTVIVKLLAAQPVSSCESFGGSVLTLLSQFTVVGHRSSADNCQRNLRAELSWNASTSGCNYAGGIIPFRCGWASLAKRFQQVHAPRPQEPWECLVARRLTTVTELCSGHNCPARLWAAPRRSTGSLLGCRISAILFFYCEPSCPTKTSRKH